MAATVARNKQDVDSMDKRERLYDSLSYTYGKKGDKISQEFDKARSQADRQALSRGMQRSSYNAQTLANIDRQRIEALDDNESAMIADYENRLSDIEQQEQAADQWERQFGESQRQFNEQMAYNRERANVADTQWGKEYDEKLRQFDTQMAYNRERANAADAQWEREYNERLRQFNEQMAYQRERANVSDAQWEKEYAEKLRQFNEQMAASRSASSSSSSYSYSGRSSGGTTGETAGVETSASGLPQWQAEGFASYDEWLDNLYYGQRLTGGKTNLNNVSNNSSRRKLTPQGYDYIV